MTTSEIGSEKTHPNDESWAVLLKPLAAAHGVCVFVVDNQTAVVPVTLCSLLPPCQGHLGSSEQY
jgi:hypothetical protein